MLLADWLSHLAGWSVCWGCCVVSLQICSRGRGGGGRGATRVCLVGSSRLLISGEQMEEGPRLAGDQFYPRSSNNSGGNLGLFLSSAAAAGRCHLPGKSWRRMRRTRETSLRHTQDARSVSLLRFPGRLWKEQRSAADGVLSLVTFHYFVYSHLFTHTSSSSYLFVSPRAASRNLPASCYSEASPTAAADFLSGSTWSQTCCKQKWDFVESSCWSICRITESLCVQQFAQFNLTGTSWSLVPNIIWGWLLIIWSHSERKPTLKSCCQNLLLLETICR